LRRAALGLLLAFAGSAQAEPVAFGTRSLEIPAPPGFVAVAQEMPQFLQISQAFLPPQNRLVEIYVAPEDREDLRAAREAPLARYFQLQVGKPVEGMVIAAGDFLQARDTMESELKKALGTLDEQSKQITEKGNEQLKQITGSDVEVEFGQIRYLGTFRREPWGLFFALGSDVSLSDAEGETSSVVCAGALVLVNHQVLYLYAYADDTGASAREWAQDAVSAWAEATRSANPDDPEIAKTAVSMGGNENFKTGGAIIGSGVGVIIALLVSRRRRKTS
jgi:hypothetical protein